MNSQDSFAKWLLDSLHDVHAGGAPAFPTLAIETIGLGLGLGLGIWLGLGIAGVGITGVGIAVCTPSTSACCLSASLHGGSCPEDMSPF